MWDLSGLERFIPRIEALSAKNIRFVVGYETDDITQDKFSKWEKHSDLVKVEFNNYPSYGKWLFSKRKILNELQDSDFDISLSLSGLWFQYYSEYIANELEKPYVLFLRGDDFTAPEIQRRGYLKLKMRKAIYRQHGWNVDRVIPITKDLAQIAIDHGVPSHKISKPIRGGIDTKLFHPMNDVEKFSSELTIGYAGRINKEKGSDFLEKIIKTNPNIHFRIAGRIQTEIDLPKNATFMGRINHKDMPEFYTRCDAIILTSLTEGFPRVILEAYACGIPVFVTSESLPSDCEIHGMRMGRNLQTWNKLFKWLGDDPEFLEKEGRRARDYSLEFSNEAYAELMKEEFEKVLY